MHAQILCIHNKFQFNLIYSQLTRHIHSDFGYIDDSNLNNSVCFLQQMWNVVNKADKLIIDLIAFLFLPDDKDIWKSLSGNWAWYIYQNDLIKKNWKEKVKRIRETIFINK